MLQGRIFIYGATDDPRVNNARAPSGRSARMPQRTFTPAGSNWCFVPRRDTKHLLPSFNSGKVLLFQNVQIKGTIGSQDVNPGKTDNPKNRSGVCILTKEIDAGITFPLGYQDKVL